MAFRDVFQETGYKHLVINPDDEPGDRITVNGDMDLLNPLGKALFQQCCEEASSKTGRFKADLGESYLLPRRTGGIFNNNSCVSLNTWYNKCLGNESIKTSTLVMYSLAKGWGLTQSGSLYTFTVDSSLANGH